MLLFFSLSSRPPYLFESFQILATFVISFCCVFSIFLFSDISCVYARVILLLLRPYYHSIYRYSDFATWQINSHTIRIQSVVVGCCFFFASSLFGSVLSLLLLLLFRFLLLLCCAVAIPGPFLRILSNMWLAGWPVCCVRKIFSWHQQFS